MNANIGFSCVAATLTAIEATRDDKKKVPEVKG